MIEDVVGIARVNLLFDDASRFDAVINQLAVAYPVSDGWAATIVGDLGQFIENPLDFLEGIEPHFMLIKVGILMHDLMLRSHIIGNLSGIDQFTKGIIDIFSGSGDGLSFSGLGLGTSIDIFSNGSELVESA